MARDSATMTLRCRVTPNAKKSEILAWVEEGVKAERVLRIKLAAPPVDGKANRQLIVFLAKQFGVGKSAVRIRSGEKSRVKVVEIEGVSGADLERLVGN